ncbi:MAG TPA: hypothetical protein VGC56_06035 [Allosphingosinicella sp.]|jgi:hypothetical protein
MLRKIARNDLLNVAGGFLAMYGGVAFFCFLFLVQRWIHAAPKVPEPSHGYIYAHNEHGGITYFSAFQTTSCALLFATSVPLFFLGILISPKRNVRYRRSTLSAGANWDGDDPKGLYRVGSLLGAVAAPTLVFLVGPVFVRALVSSGVVLPFR